MLDIALCITDLDLGGAERCLTELAKRVDSSRFRPVVYCLSPKPENPQASCFAELEKVGVETHCLGATGLLSAPRILRELRRHFVAQRPQLVQTFLFHANLLGRIAARRAGVPCVASGIRVAQRRPRWRLWADRLTDSMVDCHVCVSRSVAEFSERFARLPAEKLRVIPNGIDVQRFSKEDKADLQAFGVPKGRLVAVCVGRLDEQKGLDWAIRSARRWMEQADCDLLLVGKGPLENRLRRLCGEVGISGRVHFAGWRPDLPEILAAADLLFLPSAWEGMPNVVLEAMAARLPIVATKAEGVVELLGENAAQQTVSYGDSKALAERIVSSLQDRDQNSILVEQNRRRAESEFDIQRIVKAYEDLWQSLVNVRLL